MNIQVIITLKYVSYYLIDGYVTASWFLVPKNSRKADKLGLQTYESRVEVGAANMCIRKCQV